MRARRHRDVEREGTLRQPAARAASTQSASVAPGTAADTNASTISHPTRVDSRINATSASDLIRRMPLDQIVGP